MVRLSFLAVGGLLLAVLLAACSGGEVTEEIWLQGNERWKVNLTLTLNAAELQTVGDTFESGWDELVAQADAEGISIDWSQREESDGSVSYLVNMRGQGWDSLNEASFDGDAMIRKDEAGHVHIAWNAASTTALVRDYTLTIHGGKIVSSNASSTTNNSATWRKPARIEVELTEGGFPFVGILAVGMAVVLLLGLVVVGGGGLFWLSRRQQSKATKS
jgi:hypothetical protein